MHRDDPDYEDWHFAWNIYKDEGYPLEWLTDKGPLVPIRPWWCFWRRRKMLVPMSPEDIEIYKSCHKPRVDARRQMRELGYPRLQAPIFGDW